MNLLHKAERIHEMGLMESLIHIISQLLLRFLYLIIVLSFIFCYVIDIWILRLEPKRDKDWKYSLNNQETLHKYQRLDRITEGKCLEFLKSGYKYKKTKGESNKKAHKDIARRVWCHSNSSKIECNARRG